jgi:DNA-directed RNA polymerase subunit K
MQKQGKFEDYTRYEIARILGARSLQIAMDAPILLKISEEKLKEIKYDSLKIAEMEFEEEVLPITVKRPLPKRKEDKLEVREERIADEEIIEKEKEIESEIVEKAEEIGLVNEGEDLAEVEPEETGGDERE